MALSHSLHYSISLELFEFWCSRQAKPVVYPSSIHPSSSSVAVKAFLATQEFWLKPIKANKTGCQSEKVSKSAGKEENAAAVLTFTSWMYETRSVLRLCLHSKKLKAKSMQNTTGEQCKTSSPTRSTLLLTLRRQYSCAVLIWNWINLLRYYSATQSRVRITYGKLRGFCNQLNLIYKYKLWISCCCCCCASEEFKVFYILVREIINIVLQHNWMIFDLVLGWSWFQELNC